MKVICDLCSEFPIEAIGIKKPEKNQGFNGKIHWKFTAKITYHLHSVNNVTRNIVRCVS